MIKNDSTHLCKFFCLQGSRKSLTYLILTTLWRAHDLPCMSSKTKPQTKHFIHGCQVVSDRVELIPILCQEENRSKCFMNLFRRRQRGQGRRAGKHTRACCIFNRSWWSLWRADATASVERAVRRGPLLKRILAPFWSEQMRNTSWLGCTIKRNSHSSPDMALAFLLVPLLLALLSSFIVHVLRTYMPGTMLGTR